MSTAKKKRSLAHLDITENNVAKKRKIDESIVQKLSNRLKNDGKFFDVTFVVGDGNNIKTFKCVRSLFAMQSTVFENMLYGDFYESNCNEVILKDIEPDAFKYIRNTFHLQNPELNYNILLHVFYAANKYLLKDIEKKCTEYLQNINNINDWYCIMNNMGQYATSLLLKLCTKNSFVKSFISNILNNDKITSLTLIQMETLLIQNYHQYCNNNQYAFNACIKWIKCYKKNTNNNKILINKFIKYINFEKMNTLFLLQTVRNENIMNENKLLDILTLKEKGQFNILQLILNDKQLQNLDIGDQIDHRDNKGLYFKATIIDKTNTKIKIHYDGHDTKYDSWINLTQSASIVYSGSISQREPTSNLKMITIGQFVDVNKHVFNTKDDVSKNIEWILAKVIGPNSREITEFFKQKPKSGQIQIISNNQPKFVRWVHVDNPMQIKSNDNYPIKQYAIRTSS